MTGTFFRNLVFLTFLGSFLLAGTSVSASQVSGVVLSYSDDSPVAGARVQVLHTGISVVTDEEGRFYLDGDLLDGDFLDGDFAADIVLRINHPFFMTWESSKPPGDDEWVIKLAPLVHDVEEVLVTDVAETRNLLDSEPAASLGGQELQRNLGGTIAATMGDMPSVTQRSMGPAPARPVVRGLDGNRLLVLEDGTSTGDLSASSPDHAVIVEPLLASRIDLVRGPAAFQYGANVIGGAIDVVRGPLPDGSIQEWGGVAGVQYESVNEGRAGQVGFTGREGNILFKGDAVVRRTGDMNTPVGVLRNTDGDGWEISGGTGWTSNQAELAFAAGRVEANYGIPGGFLGGHPNGVGIELERTRYDGHVLLWNTLGLEQIEVLGSYKSYYHEEIEAAGACGVAFGLLTYDALVRARVAEGHLLGGTVFGLSYQNRDLATACLSFLPRTEEESFGGFAFRSWDLGAMALEAAVRWDHRSITPASEEYNKAGFIRERNFDGASGSLAASWPFAENQRLRAIMSRTYQPPAIEELFSEGPHLAAYSYEVGNADLGAERSLGWELEYHLENERTHLKAAAFYYDIDGYIFAADTGELEYGPGEEGFLSLYRYKGLDARLTGAELSAGVLLTPHWSLKATGSYVRGDLFHQESDHLPRIPPLVGHLDCLWSRGGSRVTVTMRGAAPQDQLGEFEESTAGWWTLDMGFEKEIYQGRWQHIIVLRGSNLLDTEYRNHLSRIKSIMPEAGRGISLVYRIHY